PERFSCWHRGHCMPGLQRARPWNGRPSVAALSQMVKDAGARPFNGVERLCRETLTRYYSRSRTVANLRGGVAMPVYEYYCDKCEREVTLTCRFENTRQGRSSAPSVAAKLCGHC